MIEICIPSYFLCKLIKSGVIGEISFKQFIAFGVLFIAFILQWVL